MPRSQPRTYRLFSRRLHRAVAIAFALVLSATVPEHANAQEPTARASVAGRATDVSDHPLAGVTIALNPGSHTTITSIDGSFSISGLSAGKYILTARRLGFEPAESEVTLTEGKRLDVDLEMEQLAQRLTERTIRVDSVRTPLWDAIQHRNVTGAGNVFSPAMLEQNRGRTIIDMLSRQARGVSVTQYEGKLLLTSSRGSTSISKGSPAADPSRNGSPHGCYAQIYLDGARIYYPGNGQRVPDLAVYDSAMFEAVEFYPSAAATPAEYGGTGASCGTLLLWTRVKP